MNFEISEILFICKKYGVWVILNIFFFGLEYSENGFWKWDFK